MMETEYFTLHNLSDGVYAAIAKPGKGAWSNAGVVDLGDGLLIFDSFATPSAAQELRIQAEKMTGKKAKYLINSHYHIDHVFGNQVYMDATIISTSLTRKWCKDQNVIHDVSKEQKDMEEYLQNLKNQIDTTTHLPLKNSLSNQYKEMSKVLEDLPYMEIVLPSLTFEKNLVIYGSNRKVELHCLGGGHSPSDTFMYLPAEEIAFMGDLVTEELHLPIYNPEEFISILNNIKQMEVKTVIPGHGGIGTLKLCDTIINYLSYMIGTTKEAHRNKVSLNKFISGFIIPDEYKNWSGTNWLNGNLSTIYNFYVK
ncbi:MBL fold metallo-hydrolase [Chengkuizengella sediminis]|uniref:MBL fold metallo-hydrolase n=1 Tax=Chengkuizengella sediminis TaxID=1885917 RepID=UPI00138A5837|nr:MBL fold metallo-hydrolase [Chengkuizengella sediminis]NDI35337.1 MBL fold metallo-hydrolase [Chengkuizengella sediminis]